MKTWILPGAVTLAALSLLLWERRDRAEESARLQQELKRLEQQVESQTQQSASERDATRRRLEQLAIATPAPAAPVAPAAAQRPLGENRRDTAPETSTAESFDPQGMADQLEAAFFHEGLDREWAEPARRTLQEKTVSLLPVGSSIRSLECQSTLCRVELVHDTNESYRQFQRRHLQEGPLWKGASVTRTEKGAREGEFLTVSYFAREGHALPLPDAAHP